MIYLSNEMLLAVQHWSISSYFHYEDCDNQSNAKHHENVNPLVTNKSILE